MVVTNATRAAWALTAAEAFADLTGQRIPAPDCEGHTETLTEAVGDLLTDLHHLCRRSGLDWTTLVSNAEVMAAIEVAEDPEDDEDDEEGPARRCTVAEGIMPCDRDPCECVAMVGGAS